MKQTRRQFLGTSVAVGAFLVASAGGSSGWEAIRRWLEGASPHGVGTFSEDYDAGRVIYTTCVQCNSLCSIKALLTEVPGRADHDPTCFVRKIAGNPYSPINTVPYGPAPYTMPAQQVARRGTMRMAITSHAGRGGRACLKGQAGIQTAFDLHRITRPLRRVGPRGSGRWESITWEEAIREILDGSPKLGTPGLRKLWAFVPEEQVKADLERVKRGEMSQADFEAEYRETLIDPRHPDLGPRANQIACIGGDRGTFVGQRLWNQSLGSVNFFNHGGICGVSGVIGTRRSHQGEQKKDRLYADLEHCDFLIVWGSNPAVANKGPVYLAPMLTNALARGMKMAVVDPRLSATAQKADWWVPVRPGADAALALGMARWIVENERYDRRYLTNPNRKAAAAGGEPTWSDATFLVRLDQPSRPLLKASEIGLVPAGSEADGPVVLWQGKPLPAKEAPEGELFVRTEIAGIPVRSVFDLYRERVMEKSLEEYARLAGIPLELLVTLAREWTSHGKRVAILAYRGPAMHTNGYYTLRAINTLNHLVGNHDWKGGDMNAGAQFHDVKGRYDLLNVPGAHKAWGVPITRQQVDYRKVSLSKEGPARRYWYPFSGNLCQEVLPSAGAGYPYPLKALFLYRHSPLASDPAPQLQEEVLRSPEKLPLVVAFDLEIGESSRYADFLLPDLSYLERWGLEHIYPILRTRFSHIQQPVTRVFPDPEGPRDVQDVLIELFKRMGLPGVGPGAFPGGEPLDRAEDFYLKVVANIAFDGEPVPDADEEEEAAFERARLLALGPTWDPVAWRRAVNPEEWRKVVYVLNRGGRFEAPGREYEGEWLRYRFGGQANFYDPGVAALTHPVTGEHFDGLPRLEPVRRFDGQELDDPRPLQLINWKARNLGTHRTIADAWLREVRGENVLWIHPGDAAPRSIREGDWVWAEAASGRARARAHLTEAIRPGVVGAAYNFGHTAYGSRPVWIDGRLIPAVRPYGHTSFPLDQPTHEESGYAPDRGGGWNPNVVQPVDPLLHMGLQDPIGGGASELDARVEVRRA
ncbi:MAG: molybdopterin-dependent oxidoreductase [Firmicutes bacterium]|nr:molybdopterin-dependent oxidoreductase [Bacillota bacterium]